MNFHILHEWKMWGQQVQYMLIYKMLVCFMLIIISNMLVNLASQNLQFNP